MPEQAQTSGSTVVPCLRYHDAPAMIDWLCTVVGFRKKAVHTADDGSIAHAELTLGPGMLMLSSAPAPGDTSLWATLLRHPDALGGVETQCPALKVDDPDAVYERARASGAEIVEEIEDKGYGGRGFSCRDPEGHLWAIGSYDPWAG